MARNLLISLVAILALTAGIVAKKQLLPHTKQTQSTLPAFSLPDISGKQRSINEWQGNVLLINFWATWCPPCRKEIPEFIALQEQYAAKGFTVIGIALDDKEAIDQYLAETKINYPLLLATNEGTKLTRQLGNTIDAVPFSLLVDRNGNIVYRQPGELSKEKILEIIKPLL